MDLDDGQCVVNERITELIEAWRTEVHAPEILPYKTDLIEEIRGLLNNQQELLDKQIDRAIETEVFALAMYQMDTERIKYSLCRYLRTRVLKIQNMAEFITSDIEMMDRLSPPEQTLLDQILALTASHLNESVVSRLSSKAAESFSIFEHRKMHAQPKLNSELLPLFPSMIRHVYLPMAQGFVFCLAVEDIADISIAGKYLSVRRGDINILQYFVIKDYIVDGRMLLL